MIKIKICDVAPRGACSYYRGIGPLSKLAKINPEIQIEYLEAISWTVLSDCDILFLMRPIETNYIETMYLAKSFGIPVWIDFDDCLHEIPDDNPARYYIQDRLKNMETAVKIADVVSVSTNHIKRYYQQWNANIHVIENAFNDYNYILEKRENDNKYISWRGSATHRKDLLSCTEDIITISKQYPDWEWAFIGADANREWFLYEPIEKCAMIPEMEIVKYNQYIYDLKSSIHIIPLINTAFNHSKSNISWIEGTWAGSVCIAPEFNEFKKPGCLTYTDNFRYLLEKSIKSKSFRQENYEKSLQYIKDNLLLSQINQKRISIIEDLIRK